MFNKILPALALFLAVASPAARAVLLCQNGGTYDRVHNECICTAHFHGTLCELSFVSSNPCSAELPVLRDRSAVHRLGNHEVCGSSEDQPCLDFSNIRSGWYRVMSPAGNYLVDKCPRKMVDCGSRTPHILANHEPENNTNIRLFRARAYPYQPELKNCCYDIHGTSYLVRILECSPYDTVYYLTSLPRRHHFCIGDKSKCENGTISIDGSGFEPCTKRCVPELVDNPVAPSLRLEYRRQGNLFAASFYCNVFPIFKSNGSGIDGVKYQVDFQLTLRNGAFIIIPECRWRNQIIDGGSNRTFECESEDVLTRDVNVYGGSLVCRVQARCNRAGEQYNSVLVPSKSHNFFFTHWFANQTDVIVPDVPVTLCVSSWNIPVIGLVTFHVSVGRKQIILNDRINVSVVRRESNESCGFAMKNDAYEQKQICMDLTLYNQDPDNRIPLGLAKPDQISVIKVKIYYSSSADGLSTLLLPKGRPPMQAIHDIELKVDLTRLLTQVKTYLHIFTDPFIKPAHRDYSSVFHVKTSSRQHFMLVKHKLLPYEIQGTMFGDSIIDITIRYVYDVIHIYGSFSSRTLSYRTIPKALPPGEKNPLPKKPDGLPFGVTVTATPQVIRVRFDLYGTILYVWGFLTNPAFSSCPHNFVMNNKAMTQQPCTGKVHQPNLAPDRITLDVKLVPGFYDTPNHVEGMLYTDDLPKPIQRLDEALLDSSYRMKRIQAIDSKIKPTEVLNICSCGEDSSGRITSNCFVSIDSIKPSSTQSGYRRLQQRPGRTPSINNTLSQAPTRKISEQEAGEMCSKFVQVQISKSVSTEICSATTGPVGEADYITQFRDLCVQYAITLGTFEYTQSIFNSVLGMCYTDLTYNATVVLQNSTQFETLLENMCPANCSQRGVCISGECRCDEGFWGTSCELEVSKIDQMPTEISLLQQDVFCPTDKCSAVYLMVKPILKSEDAVCNILVDSRHKFTTPATYVGGDIVVCDMRGPKSWLARERRVYARLQIEVTSATWNATNTVQLLLHLSKCGNLQVVCDATSMTCRLGFGKHTAASQRVDPSSDLCYEASQGQSVHPASSAASLFVSQAVMAVSWLLGARLVWKM